jgi:hypothetical protein
MKLFEAYGDYLNKSEVKEICGMILGGGDMERNIGILADMYDDVGNDLKASVIRRGVDLGGRGYVRGLFMDAFERGASDGIVYFGTGSELSYWEEQPWWHYAVSVNGSDIFESGVEYRVTMREREDVSDINMFVDVCSPVPRGMTDRCRGMQMSVLQHVETSEESPVGEISEMTVVIRALDIDRGSSWKVSVPFENLRQFDGEGITRILRPSGKWVGEVGGVRVLVDKRLAYESGDCVSKIKGEFMRKLLKMVRTAIPRFFVINMDFESYEYLNKLAGME